MGVSFQEIHGGSDDVDNLADLLSKISIVERHYITAGLNKQHQWIFISYRYQQAAQECRFRRNKCNFGRCNFQTVFNRQL